MVYAGVYSLHISYGVFIMKEILGDIFRFVFSFTVFIGAVLLIILSAWPLWISIAAIVYIFR